MDPILISNLPFERWLALIFDPPVANLDNFLWGGWWFDPAAPNLDAYRVPAAAIQYMTRLFADSTRLLAPYDDLRVGLGLYYLISNGASEHGLALVNESVPVEDRERCLRALPGLYEGIFAARLPARTSRALDDPSALQLTCYMWWDVLPLVGHPDNRTASPPGPGRAGRDGRRPDAGLAALPGERPARPGPLARRLSGRGRGPHRSLPGPPPVPGPGRVRPRRPHRLCAVEAVIGSW